MLRLLRRILTVFVVTAYIGATLLQATPGYAGTMKHAAMDATAMSGMMHDQDQPGDKMPCKGMLPDCVGGIGCIFLVSLPAPDILSSP